MAAFSTTASGSTWNTNANGNWTTAGNWTGGVPNAQNAVADFSTVNITADRVVNLDAGQQVGDLKFGDATTPNFNWTLSSTNSSVLNIRKTGGGIATIDVVNQTATIGVVMTVTQNTNQISKLGTGTLILTAANTYGVTTAVTAGTLLANNTTGSATSTGALSVSSGATLGGSGTIAPTGSNGINVSGVLSPGAAVGSIGTLTFDMSGTTGTATMASGASFAYNLGLSGANIGSVGSSDMLSITGASASDFTFNSNVIDFLGGGFNGYYKIFDTSSNNANTWSGLSFNATTGLISSGLSISNLGSGLTGTLLVGTASNGGTTGDIYAHIVPEPSTAILGSLGVGLLLVRRRRIPS